MSDQQAATAWAKQLLGRPNWCILDTETTGLSALAQICQIGILDSTGETLLDTLVRPTISIEPEASAIHGLTDDAVSNAPYFDDVFLDILRAIRGRDLVIYNAEFDCRLIKQSLRARGIQLAFPTSDRRQCRIFTNGGSILCAMEKFSEWCGEWSEYHGNYWWQRLPGGDHSAIGDCRATLKVIQQMAESEGDRQ